MDSTKAQTHDPQSSVVLPGGPRQNRRKMGHSEDNIGSETHMLATIHVCMSSRPQRQGRLWRNL